MDDITKWITEYWEEHGYNEETTECIIRDIKEALSEQAINADISYSDENDYS